MGFELEEEGLSILSDLAATDEPVVPSSGVGDRIDLRSMSQRNSLPVTRISTSSSTNTSTSHSSLEMIRGLKFCLPVSKSFRFYGARGIREDRAKICEVGDGSENHRS